MKRLALALCGTVLFVGASALPAQSLSRQPILDFRLPVFSPNNFKIWDLSASEAHVENRNRYTLAGVHLLMYADNEENKLEVELETPAATGDIEARTVVGDALLHVRLIAQNVDLLGADWSFEDRLPTVPGGPHARVFILRRDVVVTYQGDIGTIFAPSNAKTPDQPPRTIIEAANLEAHETGAETRLVFNGNVRLTGSTVNLTCDRLEVFGVRDAPASTAGANQAGGNIQRLLATGNVTANQGGRSIACDRADLLLAGETLTLTGNPAKFTEIERGVTIEGTRMWIERRTNHVVIDQPRLTGPAMPNFGPPVIASASVGANAPTIVTAQRLEIRRAAERGDYVLTGDVRLTGTNLELTCQRVDLFTQIAPPPGAVETLVRIEARDRVVVRQSGRQVTCDHAEILPVVALVTLTKNPVVSDTALGMTIAGTTMTLRPREEQAIIENPRVVGPALPDLGLASASATPAEVTETHISAERLEMTNSGIEGRYVFLGHVRLTGNNLALACERLEVFSQRNPTGAAPASGNIRRVFASGGVTLRQTEREASSGEAEVLPAEEQIILTGDPSVTDLLTGNVSRGTRAVFRRGDRSVQIEGADIRGRLSERPREIAPPTPPAPVSPTPSP